MLHLSKPVDAVNGFKAISESDRQSRVDDIEEVTQNVNISSVEEEIIPTKRNKENVSGGTNKKSDVLHLSHRQHQSRPVSIWTKIRSALPHIMNEGYDEAKSNLTKQKSRRRWEVPLTSKPYQGVEELQSTIASCIGAIAVYFCIGLSLPFWLEPSWTIVDALYFSMCTLTTVGYGDVIITGGQGVRAMIAKCFVAAFNIYAVCISVSALGIIARLALAHERKILARAKERTREKLIHIFDSAHDNDEEGLDDEDVDVDVDDEEDDEQCQWADHIIDEKSKCDDSPDVPQTLFGAIIRALRGQSSNFLVLAFIGGIIQRVERWSFSDLLYFWNSTAATIGFGDICPRTQLGRSMSIAFIPLSVITLGEVIASVFAFITGRVAAKAEKDFLRRQITLTDLEYLDVNDDGKVCEVDFITFMLVAMGKVDRKTMKDVQHLFHALDAGKDGYLQKEDLITLR